MYRRRIEPQTNKFNFARGIVRDNPVRCQCGVIIDNQICRSRERKKMGNALSHIVCMHTAKAAALEGACQCGAGSCAILGAVAIQAAAGALAAFFLYKGCEAAAPHIADGAKRAQDYVFSVCRVQLDNELVCKAIFDEIRAQHPHCRSARVERRNDGLYFLPHDGWYKISVNHDNQTYHFDIEIQDDGRKLFMQQSKTTPKTFHQLINDIYDRRAAGVEQLSKYTLTDKGWSFSGFSRKRTLENINQNDAILRVMQQCRQFKDKMRDYEQNPNRVVNFSTMLGVFLEGNPRAGKTMMASVIASELNMPIYTLPLDAPFLYDQLLESRIAEVPEGSLIFIDEIKEKLSQLQGRQKAYVSKGGILAALDDQHVPRGCIVVATSISAQETAEMFPADTLLANGRFGFVAKM